MKGSRDIFNRLNYYYDIKLSKNHFFQSLKLDEGAYEARNIKIIFYQRFSLKNVYSLESVSPTTGEVTLIDSQNKVKFSFVHLS